MNSHLTEFQPRTRKLELQCTSAQATVSLVNSMTRSERK